MIDIIITSFKEPKTIWKAIEAFLSQKIDEEYCITIAAPDKETLDIARKYQKKNKSVRIFKDPGKGKSYALNLLLPRLKGRVVILSDGDMFVSKNSVSALMEKFDDEEVGCVTGRPVSIDSRDKMFGYWSHLLCDAGAHKARLNRAKKGQFIECSGYIWAFRNGVIKKFPVDIPEDTIVPILFWKKGYKIGYAPNAIAYLKFPGNLHDFIEQKKRTAKGHEGLSNYKEFRDIPRMKTLRNEIIEGTFSALSYPRNFKEIIWTLLLFPLRLYVWILVFFHTKIKKQHYADAWKRIESTK